MPSDYANELSSRVGLDVTEWKKGITELTAGTKKIETSFQASAALMDDWSNSSEGLKMRIESLNDELALQKKKLEILKNAYDDVVEKEGATSKAAQELAKKMFQAQGDIKKTTEKLEYYAKAEQEVTDKTAAMAKKLEESGKKIEKVGDKIGGVGDKLTLGVTMPIIAAGTAVYKYSSDLTEAENKTESVFGNMSQYIKDWAQDSINKLGMAKSTAYDAVSLFGDMGTSMGLTRKQAADMSMSLVELSADLSSFKNVSLEQSQNALKGIFTGETESLKNLGIIMTETQLKAYAMSKGIATSYSEMSQAEKVQLRYQYVLESSSNAIGDYARTNGEAAGQMRKLPEALKELASSFRDNVEPAITPLVTSLNSVIVNFGELSNGTKSLITRTALAVAAIGPLVSIIGKTTSTAGKLTTAYSKLYAKLKKKTAATVEDTAANATNAKSLDKTAKSADGAAKNVGGIGTAAKKTTPYILAVGAALLALSAWANHFIKNYEKDLDEKYDKLLKRSEEGNDAAIKKLTDEYNAYEEKMTAKISEEEKYYNDRIANLDKDLKAQKSAIETEKKLYEEAHKERLSQLEKERDAKLAAISAGEEAQTSELQREIDALNALTEAEEKAKQEQENAQKLEDLKQAISFAKTYAEKVDAENNYTAEVKRQEEEKTKNARDEQIKQLQNKIEQIKSESSARQEQVKSEYDEAVQLENDKYEAAQEGFENRLSALDGFIESETERLEALRDKNISIMQSETDSYLAELQKRIDKQKELKEAAEETIEAQKEAENSSLNWLEKVYAGGQKLRDRFSDVQNETSIGSFFKKLNDPNYQQNLINKLTGHNASGTDDWRGGLTFINEKGGEIVNLPRHTQIIPHDVSMEMAREYGRQCAMYTTNNNDSNNSYNTYNYGAQQQVTVLSVDGKNVTEVIEPRVSVKMSNDIYGRRRSGGAR